MKSWIEALKEFNKGKKYTIPKKGTAEYAAVKKLMGSPMEKPMKK